MCVKVKIMQMKCVFSKKGAWLRFFMSGNSLLWKFFCANSRKKNPTFKMKSQNYNDISFCFPVLTFTSNGLRLSVVPKWIFVFVIIHLWRSLLWRWSAVCLQKKSWIQNIISTYEKKRWNHCCFQSANRYFNWKKKKEY